MVQGVAGGAVDDGGGGDVLAVVDEDGPAVDEDEQGDVGDFLKGKEEGVDVVGKGLAEAVERVEGMRGEGGGHDPFVVRFVQVLVECRVMETAVDPVDPEVCEEDEEGKLEVVVLGKGGGSRGVVEFGVAAHFGHEEGNGQEGQEGHADHGLLYLEADLVLEVFWVSEGGVVEDEVVGRGGADKVDDQAKCPVALSEHVRARVRQGSGSPGDQEQTQGLPVERVSRPGALIGILRWFNPEKACRRLVGVGGSRCCAFSYT